MQHTTAVLYEEPNEAGAKQKSSSALATGECFATWQAILSQLREPLASEVSVRGKL